MVYQALNQQKLYFPEDLIYFYSVLADTTLILNPSLGTFTSIPGTIEATYSNTANNEKISDPSIIDNLSKLIINRVIYYGAYRPSLKEGVQTLPDVVYWEVTSGCTLRCSYCYMNASGVSNLKFWI